MVTNHRKKSSRGRGSWTHGHGEKKKHRGAGSRGGRGNAGSGKRGDAKKPSYWKTDKFKGKQGFANPTAKSTRTMTLAQINVNLSKLLATGIAKQEKNTYILDLQAIGVQKLLATGTPANAYTITVKMATSLAVEKVTAAGGSVSVGLDSKTKEE